MHLRDARPEEARALTELALRSKRVHGYDDEFMERALPDMIVHPEYLAGEHGIVAERDAVTLGYAIVRVDGEGAFLRDLFVEPSHIGRGVGTALFHECVRYARERGAKRLTLVGDPNATGFYERFGMRRIGSEPSNVAAGRMLPLMCLDL